MKPYEYSNSYEKNKKHFVREEIKSRVYHYCAVEVKQSGRDLRLPLRKASLYPFAVPLAVHGIHVSVQLLCARARACYMRLCVWGGSVCECFEGHHFCTPHTPIRRINKYSSYTEYDTTRALLVLLMRYTKVLGLILCLHRYIGVLRTKHQ